MLSAIILTKNEEKNIKDCLNSLKFCDELIVIDDYSTDNTTKKARQFKAKVYNRNLKADFSSQRNFGLEKAKGDWVLFVDADERISADLTAEIRVQGPGSKVQGVKGYYIRREDIFLGKKLKFGETSSIKLLRLARKDSGRWVGKVHEKWQVKGETAVLKNSLTHHRNLTIARFLERINFYSTLRAKELFNKGHKTNIFFISLYPKAKFIQNYFFRLGFLDGIRGFVFAMMMSLHSFMVRAKLWVMQKNKGRDNFIIKDWQKAIN